MDSAILSAPSLESEGFLVVELVAPARLVSMLTRPSALPAPEMAHEPYLKLLSAAIALPKGLAVICTSPQAADKVKRLLYSARAKARESGDTTLDSLSISIAPHSDDTLFVYIRSDSEETSP